ncbi:MAG: DUF6318 family protein [Actinomycetaceae bacterium]|nr:DUF6318 family protein [Actinomycetaceae bacterium]
MCPDRHDYGGGSPRYSGAARRGEDREFERDDPEMDRVIRRWWWAAGISWLVAICVVYLTFCHKPPQEPSTSAVRPAAPAAVVQSGAGQSGAGQSGGGAGGQSGATGGQSVGDGPMSNGYRVGPDGRLLQPDQGNLTPPELPEEAKQESAAGAEAYAKYYFALLSYALKTGDTDELKSTYNTDCKSCAQRTANIENQYKNGGWFHGEGHLIEESYPGIQLNDEERARHRWQVYMRLHTPAYTQYYPDGSLKPTQENRTEVLTETCWKGDAWTICGTTIEERK